jgi:hypothetical protein
MLYAILIYGSEAEFRGLPASEYDAVMARHGELRAEFTKAGKLGPMVRLEASANAKTLRPAGKPAIIDGPFAETKEQLMGLYVIDCADREEALAAARRLDFKSGVLEVRAIASCGRGVLSE